MIYARERRKATQSRHALKEHKCPKCGRVIRGNSYNQHAKHCERGDPHAAEPGVIKTRWDERLGDWLSVKLCERAIRPDGKLSYKVTNHRFNTEVHVTSRDNAFYAMRHPEGWCERTKLLLGKKGDGGGK